MFEAFIAVQAGIAWNLIYEPKHERVVSTVGRLWNQEYGGYCLFGWDNFFLAYMTALDNKDLAYANVIEHLKGKTEEGFIPNDNRGNGSKSFDRSQPPVGGIMVKEIYKKYPGKWFLQATFDDLLGWNRWWVKRRMNNGLLSYGSHVTKNPFNEPAVNTRRTAGYESGMDDSPMYESVTFNKEKNTMELQDVGLNSLYIADCEALAEKSLQFFLNEWRRKGYVSENYSSITGTGDDARLSSDKFHSWGALFGIISFIEKGYLPGPEETMR